MTFNDLLILQTAVYIPNTDQYIIYYILNLLIFDIIMTLESRA